MTKILNDREVRALLRQLGQLSGGEIKALPRVVTLSGRQAEVMERFETRDPRRILIQTPDGAAAVAPPEPPLGSTADVIPSVTPDGHSIALTVIAGGLRFRGFRPPPAKDLQFLPNPVPAAMPIFIREESHTQLRVQDGDTVVLTGVPLDEPRRFLDAGSAERAKSLPPPKRTLLFITLTIIDPAGNRVHPALKEQIWKGVREAIILPASKLLHVGGRRNPA